MPIKLKVNNNNLNLEAPIKQIGAPGNVQPDWNQNDETAKDYVKNRPFYTDTPVETVFVKESTVPFQNNGSLYVAILESTFEATTGETYKVHWNGTIYECICTDFEGLKAIGNISIINRGSDTGEPFFMQVANGDRILICTLDTSDSHTFSISGIVEPIVKIPSKYIDKDTSGYIVVHKSYTMTEEDVQNYINAYFEGRIRFIMWMGLCITSLDNDYTDEIRLTTQNGEIYSIAKNNEGLFEYYDKEFIDARFPFTEAVGVYVNKETTRIFPKSRQPGVGTTNTVFEVRPDGMKSKSFEVFENGEAVAPALILYSSTANSTKKFRITVDDSGALTAKEVR